MSKKNRKETKKKQTILNIVLGISVVLLLLSVASVFFVNRDEAFMFGLKPYMISSESMEPNYHKYSLVVVKNESYDDVQVGDVIAFKAKQLNGQPAFHRVIAITPEGFVTKGDANKIKDDQMVTRDAFLGREVWSTNITATIIPLLKTPKGIFLLIVLPILVISVIVILIKIIKISKKNKREQEIAVNPEK